MNIPMVDVNAQYRDLKQEIDSAIAGVLEDGRFILGPNVNAFEKEVAHYCGTRHAVAVASGTDALHLALRAAGVGEGDEVITSPFTFIATAEAISYVGATPVFVDIDPRTFNMDPDAVAAAITDKTCAVMPVHLFGQPVDMAPIVALCEQHNLKIVEDCAQSFGAQCLGKKSGALGDLGCFSFFPSKNLGAFGDGGMVICDDDTLAESLRVYRNHGSYERYHHSLIGYNSRLDEMQAAILRVKLKQIDRFNELRRRNAHIYSETLAGSGVTTPLEDGKGLHVYHQYTIMHERRDAIHQALTDAGIASAVYYPIPLHQQAVYKAHYRDVSLPVTESVVTQVLSLPIYPELSQSSIDAVCDVIQNAL
ncbi:MAG: DegT/DnrJ/EryC1/StrS family aminotransferase [Gammaproteobacteria bacterium]|nr:DegT/DnrJ/EryC1/StrS family aminotransferase [Gammaproteobacteria bacterium]